MMIYLMLFTQILFAQTKDKIKLPDIPIYIDLGNYHQIKSRNASRLIMTMGERQKVGEVSDEQALPHLPFGPASFSLPNGFTYASEANPPLLNIILEGEIIKQMFPSQLGCGLFLLFTYLGIEYGANHYMWITDETLWVDEQSKQEDIEISKTASALVLVLLVLL